VPCIFSILLVGMSSATAAAAADATPRRPFAVRAEFALGAGGCSDCAATDPDAAFEAGIGARPVTFLEVFGSALAIFGDDSWATWGTLELRLWPFEWSEFPVRPFAAATAAYGRLATQFEGGGIRTEWTGFAFGGRVGAFLSIDERLAVGLEGGPLFGLGADRCTTTPAYYASGVCPGDVHGPARAWTILAGLSVGVL